ncbi:MAG: DUF6282 family protein [Acidimicrobiales bacterium]
MAALDEDAAGAPHIEDAEVLDLLDGAVDMHVHPSPSPFPRRVGIYAAAAQAASVGFSAIFVKSHHHSMVTDVEAAREVNGELPLPVFAGVALNDQVGGLNPYAVDLALQLGGRIVWFPTISSTAHINEHQSGLNFPTASVKLRDNTAISVTDDDGKIRTEVLDILGLIKEHDAVLNGGHLGADQLNVLINAASGMGISRIVVSHPNYVIGASSAQCGEWVSKGVHFEHCLCMYDERSSFYHWRVDVLLEYMKATGVQSTQLGSDLGQKKNPLPVEAFASIVRKLLDAGVSKADIRRLVSGTARETAGL